MALIGNAFTDYPMGGAWAAAQQSERDRYIRLALARLAPYGVENDSELDVAETGAFAAYARQLLESDGAGDQEPSLFTIRSMEVDRRRTPRPFALDGSESAGASGATSAEFDALEARVGVNESEIDDLQQDVMALEGAAGGTDLGPLSTRVTNNENAITALQSADTGFDTRLSTAESDVTALEARATTNEGAITALQSEDTALGARVTTLEGQTAPDIGPLTTRVTTAEGDIDSLESRMTTAESDIDALEARPSGGGDVELGPVLEALQRDWSVSQTATGGGISNSDVDQRSVVSIDSVDATPVNDLTPTAAITLTLDNYAGNRVPNNGKLRSELRIQDTTEAPNDGLVVACRIQPSALSVSTFGTSFIRLGQGSTGSRNAILLRQTASNSGRWSFGRARITGGVEDFAGANRGFSHVSGTDSRPSFVVGDTIFFAVQFRPRASTAEMIGFMRIVRANGMVDEFEIGESSLPFGISSYNYSAVELFGGDAAAANVFEMDQIATWKWTASTPHAHYLTHDELKNRVDAYGVQTADHKLLGFWSATLTDEFRGHTSLDIDEVNVRGELTLDNPVDLPDGTTIGGEELPTGYRNVAQTITGSGGGNSATLDEDFASYADALVTGQQIGGNQPGERQMSTIDTDLLNDNDSIALVRMQGGNDMTWDKENRTLTAGSGLEILYVKLRG